mmetsp:Transcript_26182/g.32983  ORF Transcript_26182/g.32983 Transcript_26182/m.32983 type:complete len:135 (-) Transcript_26182:50-454(-)
MTTSVFFLAKSDVHLSYRFVYDLFIIHNLKRLFLSSLFPHFVLVDNTLYSSDEDEEQYSNQYSLPTHTVTTSSTEDDSENGDFEKVSDHSSFQNEIPRTTIGVPCLKRQRVLTRPSTSTLPSSHHIITPTSVTL